MAEWGPSEVTEVEIKMMEEDGLAPEEVLAAGWCPPSVAELVPVLWD